MDINDALAGESVPDRCALVVIDMQNDYLHDDGAFARMGADVSGLQAAVPYVQRIVEGARAAAVPTIFVRQTHGPWSNTPAWVGRNRASGRGAFDEVTLVAEGTWGAEFYGVEPREGDRVVTKHRYSAFAFTDLEIVLRSVGRDTVIYAGVTSDVCVRYSAVDGLMRGFSPVLAAEATGCTAPERQRQVEADFCDHIGSVARVDTLLTSWKAV